MSHVIPKEQLTAYQRWERCRLGKAQRAQQTAAMLGTLRFAQPTLLPT